VAADGTFWAYLLPIRNIVVHTALWIALAFAWNVNHSRNSALFSLKDRRLKDSRMHQPIATAPVVRRKRKKWKRWVFLGVGVLIVAAIVLIIRQGSKPVPITTEKAAIRDLTQLVSATGKIRPKLEVKISPEVAGEIIAMPVVVGQKVKKGDPLLKIKPDNYIAAVKQTVAALSAAEAASLQIKAQMLNDELDLRRAKDLYAKKLMSEADYKAAETKSQVSASSYEASIHQIDVAKSNLDSNKELLAKCQIFSPIDGAISVLSSEIGERVVATGTFAGTEVMRVADLGTMEARVDVNENDVVNVEIGEPVRIRVDAYNGKELKGTVRQIASTATVKSEGTQQEVTNFEVRITVDNPDVELRPGMSASVDIETQTVKHVVSVPIQSVTIRSKEGGKTAEQLKESRQRNMGISETEADKQVRRELQRVVFIKEGPKVRMAPVTTGIADNNYVEIRSGIKDGDEVISGSYTAINKELKDGTQVEIEKPKSGR
jgi:HlyD family secretion protein